ncbi:MAG: hypothetical protein KME17_27755 [Cyanosarcina radialis HA8281-LM2]|jgi:hypothetical protein|nr:hypothetical protein [Cyanosarcina radialis HA8281-LM2]
MTNFNPRNNDSTERPLTTRRVDPDEVNYEEGYVDGRISEQTDRDLMVREVEEERANNGLLLGILLLALVGLGVGAYFLWARDRRPTTIVVPQSSPAAPSNQQNAPRERELVPVPVPAQPSTRTTIVVPQAPNPPASTNNNRERTVIERTNTDRTREVVPAPANPPQEQAPDVNVNVTQPTPQAPPSASPAAPVESPASDLNSPQPAPQGTTGNGSESNVENQQGTTSPSESVTSPAPAVTASPVP